MNINNSLLKRDSFIDALKGILAVLVVVGHVIDVYDINAYNNIVFKICYSFHMFLFVFISGKVLAHKEINFEFIKKRAKRLLIPYFIWSLIQFLLTSLSEKITFFLTKLLFEPFFWYLIVLFLCDVFLFICNKFKTNKKSLICAIIIFFGLNILYVLPINLCETLKMVAIYFPFYYAGYYITKTDLKLKPTIKILCIILYPISMLFYGFKDHTEQIDLIKNILSAIKINDELIYKLINLLEKFGFSFYNHFVVSVLGCVFFYYIFKLIFRIKPISNIFSFLGKYSLQLYLMAGMFFIPIFSNNIANEIFNIVFSVTCTVIISYFINKIPKLKKVLFG